MVRRGSDGAAWLIWCGVAHYGAAWLFMVRRGSVGSASACWKAGPSSILGSAPQGGLDEWRWMNVSYHCMNVIRMHVLKKTK